LKTTQLRVGQQLTIVQDASVQEAKAAPRPAPKAATPPPSRSSKTKAK
jgi:hypothetical protein